MEYGVTTTGFRVRGYADLDAALRTSATSSFRAVLGQSSQWDLTWDSSSPVCVFYRVLESELYRLWQTLEGIYYGASPLTASGDALDLLVGEHGITRRAAKRARGLVTLRGNPGDVVRAGTVMTTGGGLKFLLEGDVTLPANGTRDAWVEAEKPGKGYNVGSGAIRLVESGFVNAKVDSTYEAVTLGVTIPSNVRWEIPADGEAKSFQVIRASDIAHPHNITEVRFRFRNPSEDAGEKTFRLEVWLVDDQAGTLLGRTGEMVVKLARGAEQEVRWSGLSWDVGYKYNRLRLAIVNSQRSDSTVEVLGNTSNPYPHGYFYHAGVEQVGKAALFRLVSVRPGGAWGGEDREGDAELRLRFLETKATGGSAHFLALKGRLLAVPGVRAVKLLHNREDVVINGLDPHSFHAIIEGGTEEAIARAILQTAPAGIKSLGALTVDVMDDYGELHPIRFSRPTVVEVYAKVTVVRGAGFDMESVTAIKDAIVGAIGGVTSDGVYRTNGIGAGVSYAKVIEAIMRVKGVVDVEELKVGFESPPSQSGNLPIDDDELAECAIERVEVSWTGRPGGGGA